MAIIAIKGANLVSPVVKNVTNPLNKFVPSLKLIDNLKNDVFEKSKLQAIPTLEDEFEDEFEDEIKLPMYSETLNAKGKKSQKQGTIPKAIKGKVFSAIKNMKKEYGKDILEISFDKDLYTPNENWVLKAEMKDDSSRAEYYDKNMNKVVDEHIYLYENLKNDELYQITKSKDYRNNTATKVRMQVDAQGQPLVTDEVRIIKDKDNNIVRKEYMTHAVVTGAYDQKYVYPNGTEKIISKVRKFEKSDGIDVIHKEMDSLDGTKTKYNFEQDKLGNRLLDYEITDKNGETLMKLNKTIERIDDNTFRSSNGNKIFETTFDAKKVTIQEIGKDKPTVIQLNKKLRGDKPMMVSLLKKLPGDQLVALNQTVRVLKGVQDTSDCCMWPDKKQIDTIDDLFSVLHETGHSIDFRKSTKYDEVNSLSGDKQIQKVYTEEKATFNKAFPNAQRDHVGYFIQEKDHYAGEWGGLGEVVAEVNAIRDSYTVEEILAPRVQYLQQYYPKTIACINEKLENYTATIKPTDKSKVKK